MVEQESMRKKEVYLKNHSNMRVMLKWKLTEYLDLDESQAEKFFPKMNSHEKELKSINKEFTNEYNIKVNVISLGTGQAIRIAKDGNAEILLVHHTASELLFMKNGYGKVRHNLMYNDFVLVGPKTDTKKCDSINEKLIEIKNNKGDNIPNKT